MANGNQPGITGSPDNRRYTVRLIAPRGRPVKSTLKSNSIKSSGEPPEDTKFLLCQNCGYVVSELETLFSTIDGFDDYLVYDPMDLMISDLVSAICPHCGNRIENEICYMPRDFEVTKTYPPSEEKLRMATLATRYGLPEQRQSYDEISDKYGLPAPGEQSLADKYGLTSFSRRKGDNFRMSKRRGKL